MTEQDFFNRLVTFSFGGHEFMENTYEVIVLIPENTTVEDFKNSYNEIVKDLEEKNDKINKELEEYSEKCRKISLFLKKYCNKNDIKEKAKVKIDKKEKELYFLLSQWREIRKNLVNVDGEFNNIIQSIGGVILEEQIKHNLVDHNNSSMIVY